MVSTTKNLWSRRGKKEKPLDIPDETVINSSSQSYFYADQSIEQKTIQVQETKSETIIINEEKNIEKEKDLSMVDTNNEFDFAEDNTSKEEKSQFLLPDNLAVSSINVGFLGFGAAGNRLAKSFLDLGFNKTLLIRISCLFSRDAFFWFWQII